MGFPDHEKDFPGWTLALIFGCAPAHRIDPAGPGPVFINTATLRGYEGAGPAFIGLHFQKNRREAVVFAQLHFSVVIEKDPGGKAQTVF